MAMDKNKVAKTAELINDIADKINEDPSSPVLSFLKSELEKITGKEDIDIFQFRDFWEFQSAESLAERLLMPEAKRLGLSDERIYEVIKNICLAYYSEAETDYWLEVLKLETGLPVSDYIYFPYTKGLEVTADEKKITDAVLADRKI